MKPDNASMRRIETQRFFGRAGKPIHAATLYRGVQDGRFPKPRKIGKFRQWLVTECEAALERIRAEREIRLSEKVARFIARERARPHLIP
jgi:hypothetical protein